MASQKVHWRGSAWDQTKEVDLVPRLGLEMELEKVFEMALGSVPLRVFAKALD